MRLHNSYELTQRNIAELVAFLKNTTVYENDRKLFIVNPETLNEHINQLLMEKKFIGANDLIKSAQNHFENKDIISAEIISKSIRIQFPLFYKLLVIAENEEMSLADVLRKLIVSKLKSSLVEIKKHSDVDQNKIEKLRSVLAEWEHKKNTKHYSINDTGYYIGKGRRHYTDLSDMITFDIDTLLMKYLQLLVSHVVNKHQLPNKIAQVYAESYMDKKTWMSYGNGNSESYNPFNKRFEALFECVDTHLNINLSANYRDIDNPDLDDYSDAKILNKFGEKISIEFFNILQNYGIEFGEIELGNYDLVINEQTVLINDINILDNENFQKFIYNKLNTTCLFKSSWSDKSEYENISLIDSDFNEEIYSNYLQQSISQEDYETASKYSEILQTHFILNELSSAICDIFNKIIHESRVVTFTIPRGLMILLDMTIEDNSLRTFVANELNDYWNIMNEIEVNK